MSGKSLAAGFTTPPIIWLGQSVDTSVLPARYPGMRRWPVITSLGDAMRKEHYLRSHFHAGLRETLGMRGPIMVDSGGFILMTREMAHWSASRVAQVYRALEVDVLVSLDHPPLSSDTVAQRRRKAKKTVANLDLLAGEFAADMLMPVVHGVTLAEVEDSCADIAAIMRRPRWVGVGGLVPLLKQLGGNGRPSADVLQQHLGSVIATARRAFPKAYIHVFGAGAPRSCLSAFAMGAHSADSQAWRQAAGFGSIYIPGKAQRILQWDRPHRRPRPLIDASDRQLIDRCRCPSCRRWKTASRRIVALKTGFEARSVHNAWVLHREVALFRQATSEDRIRRLLADRLPADALAHTIEARTRLLASV